MTTLKRILIVDDEVSITETLAECVGPEYTVEIAHDGTEAVRAIARTRPDVVLLDLNMPGLTGLDVLHWLRILDPSLAVLMITATDDRAAAAAALKAGAFSYIPKPFNVKYIQNLVAAAITSNAK